MGIIRVSPRDWDPSFEEFARERVPALLRTAAFLSGDVNAAEDLVQMALARTAARWRQARDHPDAYIRRVLINLVHDRWRASSRRMREIPLEAATADDGAVTGGFGPHPAPDAAFADRDQLLEALRQLPSRQRAAVVFRFWEDMSVTETAACMGCTEGTVKSATSRGLDRLRTLLTDTEFSNP